MTIVGTAEALSCWRGEQAYSAGVAGCLVSSRLVKYQYPQNHKQIKLLIYRGLTGLYLDRVQRLNYGPKSLYFRESIACFFTFAIG